MSCLTWLFLQHHDASSVRVAISTPPAGSACEEDKPRHGSGTARPQFVRCAPRGPESAGRGHGGHSSERERGRAPRSSWYIVAASACATVCHGVAHLVRCRLGRISLCRSQILGLGPPIAAAAEPLGRSWRARAPYRYVCTRWYRAPEAPGRDSPPPPPYGFDRRSDVRLQRAAPSFLFALAESVEEQRESVSLDRVGSRHDRCPPQARESAHSTGS